jgi:hypothetical protein
MRISWLVPAVMFAWLWSQPAHAAGPPVKKSTSGICHERGSSFYERTKDFEPYDSMEACVQSGGRESKAAVAAEQKQHGFIGRLIFILAGLAVVGGAYLIFRKRAN